MKKISIAITLVAAASVAIAQQKKEHLSIDRPVHSIDLPHYQPYLPAGENRELFASRCLSCHSTRYVSMQPTMPQTKWEDSVKKMIKTYGAPIAEDEAPKIAAYLVTFQKSPPDALEGTMQQTGELPALEGGDAEHGKQIFTATCANCHGPAGKGDGPNMAALLPHATDLTNGRFAPQAIEESIVHGVRGTAMPAFALPAGDLASVVAYVGQLGAKETPVQPPDPAAKALYDTAGASCHGPTGGGDGFNAAILSRRPTNFHWYQPSSADAVKVLTEGVPGTPMPSWKAKFDDKQRAMLGEYVRSLYGHK